MKRCADLIIDVGVYDGFDTSFYLSRGYRVVAIEADPMKADNCSRELAKAIEGKKLELINIGIAGEPGTLTFYRNFANGGWSSFVAEMGQRGGRFKEISVPCVTLASIVERYGVPYYLKIDIEGMDEVALSSLTPEMAPNYISVEVGSTPSVLDLLHGLGYRSFKLIRQEFHTTCEEIYDSEIGWRLLRRIGRLIPPFKTLVRALPEHWRFKEEWDRPYVFEGQTFEANSTGPFGEATHGRWIDYTEARKRLERTQAHAAKYKVPLWLDIHAKLEENL